MILLSMALRTAVGPEHAMRRRVLTLLGIFGVALFFGDSIITPAVSVLGAMEGLERINPDFLVAVVPVTVVILIGLFYVQRTGTGKVSAFFGPIMVVWFLVLGGLGIYHSASNPAVFAALNPMYALSFLLHNPGLFIVVLGSAVLAVTGAEALYADMGHFGRKPIRVAWFSFVMPMLVINYFGQGALILKTCAGKVACTMHPFYDQVPHSFLIPMVILAGLASIIASQAVISGAFSIARQGIQLGFLPRMQVIHTSHRAEGQIYLPAVNWTLLVLVLIVVITFRNTANLAAAYGLAVTGAMAIDTVLFAVVAFGLWKWNKALATLAVTVFAIVDIALLASTAIKIPMVAGSRCWSRRSFWCS